MEFPQYNASKAQEVLTFHKRERADMRRSCRASHELVRQVMNGLMFRRGLFASLQASSTPRCNW
eukprot:751172-Hanusia_phi.AAC.4